MLGCVKKKLPRTAQARDLYCSPLWNARRRYAEESARPWFIMSARYGLLTPEQRVAPYDLQIRQLSPSARRALGLEVTRDLARGFGSLQGRTVEVHAGAAYVDAIREPLNGLGAQVVVPTAGLSIGRQLAWYRDLASQPVGARRRRASSAELDGALDALDRHPTLIPVCDWPPANEAIDLPGMYTWWVDTAGARTLSSAIGVQIPAGRIYAGLTGATKWPSGRRGSMTLRRRVRQHVRGRIEGSTFRLTLSAALINPLRLQVTGPRRLAAESEAKLSRWIGDHLQIATYPSAEADALADLERCVLADLDPPLNIDGMPSSPVRNRLSELRRLLHDAAAENRSSAANP